MNIEYWCKRWRDGETGWHRQEFNDKLVRFWPELKVDSGETVFVPLCGKSKDLIWLKEQGMSVIGNEASPEAVAEFEAENGSELPNLKILCQDFFSLAPSDLAGVSAWYDRAALVALPTQERAKYFQHLAEIIPPKAKGLLLSFEFLQEESPGPPYSVGDEELHALCGEAFNFTLVEREDLSEFPKYQERGLTQAFEAVYFLQKR
jgi:thiopurine S-methyltransferase